MGTTAGEDKQRKEMKEEYEDEENVLMIKIKRIGDNENLSIRCNGSHDLILGYVARARYELSKIEEQTYKSIDENHAGTQS